MLNIRDLSEELAKQVLNSKEYLGYVPVPQTVIPTIRAARAALQDVAGCCRMLQTKTCCLVFHVQRTNFGLMSEPTKV